jgi:hypothetical protein
VGSGKQLAQKIETEELETAVKWLMESFREAKLE